MMRIFYTLIAAFAGLSFGSFLNVWLTRWTADESIVRPRSHCRSCNRTLAWWENIPLVSFAFLRGRCRTCLSPIGWRFAAVEASVGLTWAVSAWQQLPAFYLPGWSRISIFDAVLFCLVKMILCYLLIGLAVLDAERLWLPDWYTLGGAALGLPLSIARFGVHFIWRQLPLHWSMETGIASHRAHLYDAILHWFIGILAIPATILIVRWIYHQVRGRDGIGLGDVKLVFMLAVWLGLSHALLALVLALFLGFAAALFMFVRPLSRPRFENWVTSRLPFGTFLCIGGIISALWGRPILDAYLRLAGFSM